MRGCLEVIGVLVVLAFLVACALGFWHFVNSEAAEAQTWKIVESVSEGVVLIGKGFLVVLVCVGFFLICRGIREAAEPLSNAAGTYMLARRGSQLMIPNSGVEMPDIRIWPEIEKTQLMIPGQEVIGGDLPMRLIESERQTQ